jgi:hypothetical protein
VKCQLLACGILAGPLFVAVGLIQAFTRVGFDLCRHPLSLLSLGAGADPDRQLRGGRRAVPGLRRRHVAGAAPRPQWHLGPVAGRRLGGRADRGRGVRHRRGCRLPPGAPTGAPQQLSWHGILHEVGFIMAFVSCTAAWVAAFVVASWPDMDSISVRLVLASAIQFAFVAALAARLVTELADDVTGSIDAHIEFTADERPWA